MTERRIKTRSKRRTLQQTMRSVGNRRAMLKRLGQWTEPDERKAARSVMAAAIEAAAMTRDPHGRLYVQAWAFRAYFPAQTAKARAHAETARTRKDESK